MVSVKCLLWGKGTTIVDHPSFDESAFIGVVYEVRMRRTINTIALGDLSFSSQLGDIYVNIILRHYKVATRVG